MAAGRTSSSAKARGKAAEIGTGIGNMRSAGSAAETVIETEGIEGVMVSRVSATVETAAAAAAAEIGNGIAIGSGSSAAAGTLTQTAAAANGSSSSSSSGGAHCRHLSCGCRS
jgi:hypothetical protein